MNGIKQHRVENRRKGNAAVSLLSLMGFVILSFCLVLTHDLVLQAAVFNVKEVIVEGNTNLDAREIIGASGIKAGENTFIVSLEKAKEGVLNHPYVEMAEVERKLPDRIVIRIKEHIPLAFLYIEGADTYVIDKKGMIFKVKEDSDKMNLPVVTGITEAEIPLNEASFETHYKDMVSAMLRLLDKKSIVRYEWIEDIHVDRDTGISFSMCEADECENGAHKEIRIGKGDVESKLDRLDRIVTYLKEKGIYEHVTRVDIRDVNRVVVGTGLEEELPGKNKEA